MVKVITDSTSYIIDSVRKELDIRIVSLNVKFKEKSFREIDISNDEFYPLMEKEGIPMSSQPSIGEMYEAMKDVVDKGDKVLGVFLSSDMSGTYSSAHVVKNMILEEYNDAEIEIVDSRSNSMQLGYAAIAGAKEAKEGKSLEKVKEAVVDNIKRSRFIFIPDNLVYLRKGGRIGNASAIIGDFLKIIPILTVEKGKTTILQKVRTKNKAVMAMVNRMLEDFSLYGIGEAVIHHIDCREEAAALVSIISEKLNIAPGINDIGPVIGLHVGPGAIGIAYYTQRDMRETI